MISDVMRFQDVSGGEDKYVHCFHRANIFRDSFESECFEIEEIDAKDCLAISDHTFDSGHWHACVTDTVSDITVIFYRYEQGPLTKVW